MSLMHVFDVGANIRAYGILRESSKDIIEDSLCFHHHNNFPPSNFYEVTSFREAQNFSKITKPTFAIFDINF